MASRLVWLLDLGRDVGLARGDQYLEAHQPHGGFLHPPQGLGHELGQKQRAHHRPLP